MAFFGLFGKRSGREVTVYMGNAMRDVVLGMPIEEVYRTQPELQAVVSFLAANIAQLPFKCYVRESDESRPRDTEGPLPSLLANPGTGVTAYELMLGTASDLFLYGWALWWVLPSTDTQFGFELRRIPPSWVMSTKTIDGFSPSRYFIKNADTNGIQVPVPAAQCVRFQTYNPGHPTIPLSPVESLKQVLAERASSRTYRNKVWQNGGWFSRYIERPVSEGEWGKEARDRFAKSMKHHFSGKEGTDSGGIPILEDGMKFVNSTLNAKEAEWAESMRLTREDVAAAYHVNPAIVWSNDGQTYASVRENARSLYADTLGPTLRLIQDRIRLTLVPMIGADPRVYAEFDLSAKLAGSFEEQASVLSQSVGGPWMTRNEARARQNLPALEGADELIVPMNVTEGGLASPHDTDPTKTSAGTPSTKSCPHYLGEHVKTLSPRLKSRPKDTDIKDLEEVIEAFYKRQGTSLANRVAQMDASDIILDYTTEWMGIGRWTHELSDDLFDAVMEFSPKVARRVVRGMGGDPEDLDETILKLRMRKLCRIQANNIASSALIQTTKDLAKLDELTPEAAKQCIIDSYDRLMESRVKRNGAGITSSATNIATVTGASSANPDALKEWRCTGHNSRKSHIRMNGERVLLSRRFSNGAMWPGDAKLPPQESCGCACYIEIVQGKDRAEGRHVADVRAEELAIDRKIVGLYHTDFKRDEREDNYQKTVGAYIRSFSDSGNITARYRARPKGKELQTARTLADLGHTVEFLSDTGTGRHPDAKVDDVIADFKRIESQNLKKVYRAIAGAVEQGADMAVIDLALDSVTLVDAKERALTAIEDGIISRGHVMIIDWHGKLHTV